jgi:hypothetical protein
MTAGINIAKEDILLQGSQTQIYWRATFQRNVPQVIRKKLLRAATYKKSPQNKLNLIKLYSFVIF